MIRFEQLKNKPALMKCLTGLTVEGFMSLLVAFERAYEVDLSEWDEQWGGRQRARGAGRKGVLPEMAAKMGFILFYFRLYPVQLAQGFFFEMSQPQANDWIQRLSPILRTALGYDLQLPERSPRNIKTLLESCPGLEFILDGSERPIRRPKDQERQKLNYSGKKRRHTRKNNLITDKRTGKIKGLSPTAEGKRHDKKLADEQGAVFPPDSRLWQDSGFQGYRPQNVSVFRPTKKPKGRDLSPEEKQAKRAIAQERIAIEHTLAGVKVIRIVHDPFRNLRVGFDDLVMEIACGLHNFRPDHPMTT